MALREWGMGAHLKGFFKSPTSAASLNPPTAYSISTSTSTTSKNIPQASLPNPKPIPKCSFARPSFSSLPPSLMWPLFPRRILLRRCARSGSSPNAARHFLPPASAARFSPHVSLSHNQHRAPHYPGRLLAPSGGGCEAGSMYVVAW